MPIIEISSIIAAPRAKVWEYWTKPDHIVNWNFASPEWRCPKASNELVPQGKFSWRMEAKDGSMGFDFSGVYSELVDEKHIFATLDDGRTWEIYFEDIQGKTKVTEKFEAEQINDLAMQKAGWQAILNNFSQYVEKAN